MRRKDREVTGRENLEAILVACPIMRIGLVDEEGIYVVPVNYSYEYEGDDLVLYFHGAKSGRKAAALTKGNVVVGFEMDTNDGLDLDEEKYIYSIHYASIIGTGVVNVVEGEQEKLEIMLRFMKQIAGRPIEFPAKVVAACHVYKLTVREYSGKKRA